MGVEGGDLQTECHMQRPWGRKAPGLKKETENGPG